MNRHFFHVLGAIVNILWGLLTMVACSSTARRAAMLSVLDITDSLNHSYIPITSDSLLLEAVDYFDNYGTPNERLRANYLLGCAYRDMGEAPTALAAYNDAINCADTLADNCDHALLCRVNAQMAELFYCQNLMQDNLEHLDASVRHAKMAKDTLMALNAYAHKMAAFGRMELDDSVILVCNNIFKNFYLKGKTQEAARYFGLAIDSYLRKGDLEMAHRLIEAYENETGYFSADGRIEAGREAFLSSKGMYLLAIGQLDSAEMCFRKELRYGKDFDNQNMASRGLSILFTKLGKPDSAAKYALYSYAMNDSAYNHMTIREVEQAKGMYDYGRHQRNALAEKEKTKRAYTLSHLLTAIISIIIIVAAFVLERFRLKRKATKKLLYEKTRRLIQTQEELSFLRRKYLRLSDTVSNKTATINQQETAVESLSEIVARKEKELASSFSELATSHIGFSLQEQETNEIKTKLKASPAYQVLHNKDTRGEKLKSEDWESISQLVKQTLPTFYSFITAQGNRTSIKEQQLCLLFCLYVKPRRASLLIGVTPSMVTKLGKSALKKLFNANGTSKNLAERIQLLGVK